MGKKRVIRTLSYLSALACWQFLPSMAAQAATFTVNSPSDVVDASPGNGVCTLRAAIQEANALAGADEIVLPALPSPNAYILTIVTKLAITDSLTITGGGASTTTIDGNKSLRPDNGVLSIGAGIAVNVSDSAIFVAGSRLGYGSGLAAG